MLLNELMKPIDVKKDKLDALSAGYGGFNEYEIEKDQKIVEFVENHCSDFLKVMRKSGNFLYRGIDKIHNIPAVHIATTPEHRAPIGQSPKAQIILDKIFKLSGFKALRSNSLPCTSDLSNAEKWGEVYFIFPINGFDYTWSKKITDIGGSFELENNLLDFYKGPGKANIIMTKKSVDNFVKKFGFTNKNLVTAMSHSTEISIHGQYLGFLRERFFNNKIFMKAWDI